jgi:dephospho-CoA kinase
MDRLIGLTGGMGSGKTTVARMFTVMGIPVYDADSRAKALMQDDPELIAGIRDLFGPSAYAQDGTLERKHIASIVFADRGMLDRLNALVHPAVYRDLAAWATSPPQRDAPYLLQESAILFEEDLVARFAAIILVTAPEAVRIDRVMARDGASRDDVMRRLRNQWPDERKIPLSDYVIFNDGVRPLIRQVVDVDRMLRARLRR